MISINIDLSGVNQQVDALVERAKSAARPAAQAGAQVIYEQVKANVAALGSYTGNLNSAIYQVFSGDNSTDFKKVYHISWNHVKAPHGRLVEFGYIQRYARYMGKDGNWYANKKAPLAAPRQVPGKAFVRRAESSIGAAKAAMLEKFTAAMEQS